MLSDADGVLLQATLSGSEAVFALPGGRIFSAPVDGGTYSLRVFIDRCSVECFVNDGEVCFTERIYPKDNAIRYALSGCIRHVDAWTLESAFTEEKC